MPEHVIEREKPQVAPEREALVKQWLERVRKAEKHFEHVFKQMRKDEEFARGLQWPDEKADKELEFYKVNITLAHINKRVAKLYAKNPRVVYRRRKRLDFALWDGDPKKLLQAQMATAAAMTSGLPVPPEMQAFMQDVTEGMQRRQMLDRVGKTLAAVVEYYLDEPIPRFKLQAKQLVRRVLTSGVGYIKLGFQRQFNSTPEIESRIRDVQSRLEVIEQLASDFADGEIQPEQAAVEELRITLKALQEEAEMVVREGPIFSFPRANQIIPDPAMTQIKGFVGAHWIAEKFLFTPEEVQRIYKVDVKRAGYNVHKPSETERTTSGEVIAKDLAAVYEIYDLDAQLMHVVCDGYCDFLKADTKPDVELEQFHPIYALTFNDVEDGDNPFPPSNTALVRPMQLEVNRKGEALREHRIANTPAWVGPKGLLGDKDKTSLALHAAWELIELEAMKTGEDLTKILVAKPVQKVDPAMYENESTYMDFLRVSGDQQADLGPTAGDTATESTIAEQSRVSAIESNIDDLDEFLSDVLRGAGQVCLKELSQETVTKIAGPGAVWPQLSRQEIAEELYLETKAGSSGMPNRALRIAAMERIAPLMTQVPGMSITKFLETLIEHLDPTMEIEDWVDDGAPSITAMNAMSKPMGAAGADEPTQQGARGAERRPPQSSAGVNDNQFPAGQPLE